MSMHTSNGTLRTPRRSGWCTDRSGHLTEESLQEDRVYEPLMFDLSACCDDSWKRLECLVKPRQFLLLLKHASIFKQFFKRSVRFKKVGPFCQTVITICYIKNTSFCGMNPAVVAEWSKTPIKQIQVAVKSLRPRFEPRSGHIKYYYYYYYFFFFSLAYSRGLGPLR